MPRKIRVPSHSSCIQSKKQKTKQNNDTDKTEGNQGKQQASPTMLSLSSGMVSSCPGTKQMELRDKNGRYSCCFMFLHSKL
jgi:hypothetical protein